MHATHAKLQVLALCALMWTAHARLHKSSATAAANPIRRVVNMLTAMKEKVETEQDRENELYKKFECYCKGGSIALSGSIEEAERKIPELEADIKSLTAEKEQIQAKLKTEEASETEAVETKKKAAVVHDKTHKEYSEEIHEYEVDVAALDKAEKKIKGTGLIQSTSVSLLKRVAASQVHLSETGHSELLSLIEGGANPGEVAGMISRLKEEFTTEEHELEKDDEQESEEFEDLSTAKKREINALDDQIQSHTERSGEIAVSLAAKQNDLEDLEESLAEDKKMLGSMGSACIEKKKEHEENVKMRSVELAAISDTIKILNDDDALELFKKALPGPSASLLQLTATTSALQARALSILRQIKPPSAQIDLLSLALHGKKIGFEKILGLIDDLKATLEKEQADDDSKKTYCEKELDAADDQKKEEERAVADAKTAIEDAKEQIAAIIESVQNLGSGIKALDKSVAEATEQRKGEHAEYKELMTNNAAAKELLLLARTRLEKFYAKPTPSFAQLSLVRAASTSREMLATSGPYAKSEASGGVLSAIGMLIHDIEKEMTVAKTEEENSQEEYEKTMTECAEKRKADSKSLADQQAEKADLQSELESHMGAKAESEEQLAGVNKRIASLHNECDFLHKFYDFRKKARSDEIDGLIKARAVLANADLDG